MPYHDDTPRRSQVAQEAQLAHYGLPTGGAPQPKMSRPGEYKGSQSQRKPVQTGTLRNQDGPYPAMTSTPSRKPVGGYRTVSSTSTHPQSPAPAKSSGHAGYNKPLPPTPGAPATPTADSRPGSSSGWSFSRRKRTDSNASNATGASKTQRSRTGSFGSIGEAVKKTGKWLARKNDILHMDPKERDAMFASGKKYEIEQKRKAGTLPRPVYQKQYQTSQSYGLERVGSTLADADYQARQEHDASRKRRAETYKKMHERDCAAAALRGDPRPATPSCARLSPPQRRDSLTPSIDEAAKLRFGGIDPEANRPLPTKSDKYAKFLGETVFDHFKRKGSNASSMWVSDTCPTDTGAMDHCGCGRAPRKFLQKGMCEDCYDHLQSQFFSK